MLKKGLLGDGESRTEDKQNEEAENRMRWRNGGANKIGRRKLG